MIAVGSVLFCIGTLAVVYHLFGYPLLLSLFGKRSKPSETPPIDFPSITVVCAAYNEEESIEAKIKSFLTLDYPHEKIRMIVISDDSTDRTNEIVQKFTCDRVTLVIQKPRRGKVAGHNLVEPGINSDYVLSTDANSIFRPDAVKRLVRAIQADPSIGVVSGCLKLVTPEGGDSGEGLYWKYESMLKKKESDVLTILGANGSIYLMRREFFRQIDTASVDDFARVMMILQQGFIGRYEPEAVVTETVSEKPHEEINRKIRIISQEWFALARNSGVLNLVKRPRVALMMISHKVLRWTFFIWALMILTGSVIMAGNSSLFLILSVIQCAGYGLGGLELALESRGRGIRYLKPVGYLTAMVWASMVAFAKFIRGREQATWNTIRTEGV